MTSQSLRDPRAMIATEPMHRRQIAIVGLATALNALDGFDVLSISFAAPGIAADWSIDRAALGLVLSMELIGMAVGAFLLGMAADRMGRRRTTLVCLTVMAGGMALAAAATDIYSLSALRFLTGIGIGGMLATTNAIAAEFSNARQRALSVAIMAGGYPVGAVIGGSIASLLLAVTGRWEAIFLFGAIATVCFIPLTYWLVPESVAFLCARQPKGALDQINSTLASLGRAPVDALPPLEPSAGRRGIGQFFEGPMRRVTILLTLAYFGHIMTFYFFLKWIPKLVADMGFVPALAGTVLVWANVGGASGSLALSLLTRRYPVRRLVVVAMIFGALAVATFGQNLSTLGLLSLIAAVAGFFTNAAIAGLYAVFAESFPAHLRAGGTGLVIGVGRGGAALGPILGGLLFASGWPLSWVAPAMALGCIFGALALSSVRPAQE